LAPRSPQRGNASPASGKARRRGGKPKPNETALEAIEEVAARAARLGITPERVLQEYARIAFADLGHFIEWGPEGFVIKASKEIDPNDLAAVSEFVPGSDPEHSRVKLYDKKAALDAIARHLGMFPLPLRRQQQDAPEEAEDPREFLARELARLAAGGGQE
jgi:phage terminase small subunit